MSSAGPSWTPDQLQADPHSDPAKAERVQSMFTAIAPTYDLNNRIHSFGLDQAWRRRTVREVAKRLASPDHRTAGDAAKRLKPLLDKKVLDMACGTGDLTELFRKAGALATGGDYTPAMLEIARAKSARHDGADPRILFVEADATQLPFHTSTFDAVTIAFGLRNVSDPAKAIAEFFRVLRPGGVMAILEFDQPSSRLVRFVHNFYTQRIMPLTATAIARDRSGAYKYLPRSVSTFLTPQGIAHLAAASGFERIEHHSLTFGTCALTLASRPAL
ncbi:MAG: bifunctional demethylmenaquinone methyltransferase/2-methoxy-6-polyprenyl-1,4-benzoquinol methylase UbiE [Planctomycetes bacterium]|nr:bifunctional demethylmenaquinone methyltransferase/2-methoxy-6-polyprenyl-1,4-benzoquinol methylase UbiE [Planctomycetota bacterium]